MRTKKVNRYYCDFCGKGGCAAGHMKRHEQRCTLNPGRVCGMCLYGKDDNEKQPDLASLVSIVNSWEPAELHRHDYGSVEFNTAAARQLETLADAAGNCPACILSALRQAIPGRTDAVSYPYKIEAQKWLEDHRPENGRGGYE